MADDLVPEVVADRVRDDDARTAALDALEAMPPPVPSHLALAVAPALVEVVAATEDREAYNRCALLFARLLAEAAPDPSAVHGAAFAGERANTYIASRLGVEAMQRAAGSAKLTREDAYREACWYAFYGPAYVRGFTVPGAAAGKTAKEMMDLFFSNDPLSLQNMPADSVPLQLLTHLVELLRSDELSDLVIGGAWARIHFCVTGRHDLGSVALDLGLFELGAKHLRAIGGPADMVSISRGKSGVAHVVLQGIARVMKSLSYITATPRRRMPQGARRALEQSRPHVAACVSSGLFDLSVEIVRAFGWAGVDGLQDTNHGALIVALSILIYCSTQTDCEPKIRGIATALAFCLEHSLDYMEELGAATGPNAMRVCCAVFGRDEGGSEFTFTMKHLEILTDYWSHVVRGVGWRSHSMPTSDDIFAVQLCVSDKNKPLLTTNNKFISYLVESLLLDPDHPRADMKAEHKAWCQTHHSEALCQLAMFEPSRRALQQDGSVTPALEAVVEMGLSEEAKHYARSALAMLSGAKLQSIAEVRKQDEEARTALQVHTLAKEQAEARALEEASLTSSKRISMEIERLRKQAEQADASGDIEKLIEMIEQHAAAAEADQGWDEDLSNRVKQRSQRAPFREGILDDAARWTEDEMRRNLEILSEDSLGDDSTTHEMVYHFTSLLSLDLIMGGHGLRASPYGQLNGGLSVSLASPTQLDWEQWSGNRFRERVGHELWGEKWRTLLRQGKTVDGEEVEEGSDSDKIDYVIVLKVRKELVSDSSRVIPGRENVCIVHRKHLTEIDGWHYLERQHIAKIYRLSNPEQEAELTLKLIAEEEEKLEDRHVMLSYESGSEATMLRLNGSLRRRGYKTWIAAESMKDADLDAVSSAIEKADAMLIAVTNEYKESASCRLEATYAQKSKVDIIPLLVQPGYHGKGWLGMQIADKDAYDLHGANDDATFEAQVDAVARALGGRGRPSIHEAIPSMRVSKPAPIMTTASPQRRVSAPAQTVDHASIPHSLERGLSPVVDRDLLPSMQTVPMRSSVDASAMIERLLEHQRQMMREQHEELRAVRAEMLEQQRQMMREQHDEVRAVKAEMEEKMEAKLEEMQAKLAPQPAVSVEQLKALQLRVGKLHTDKLLTDDVALWAEDLIADYIELESSTSKLTRNMAQADRVVASVCKLVALSERMELDQALARQLKRVFA